MNTNHKIYVISEIRAFRSTITLSVGIKMSPKEEVATVTLFGDTLSFVTEAQS